MWNSEKSWAQNCDFSGNDLSRVNDELQNCAMHCSNTERCTHYAWSDYDGGTCFLKENRVTKEDALLAESSFATYCGFRKFFEKIWNLVEFFLLLNR